MLACVGYMDEEPGENSGVRLRSTESQPTGSIYSRRLGGVLDEHYASLTL